ncbi:ABC1 family protein C21C3.03, mitochondrial [Seminavis robusta]|uniref:ABC1 family protein C21C3.03, mitochondrial n=1 Tax=Seminavis robusta TaxID=568900 RepID=A0A9N8HGN1_9STRA|nr:ABC1 family protein C21C3.03, mitochondrial [Seminavis robusta]|eukprot:Sro647_g180860.1 ABC1 family protein C21C3.03, mitochondrial (616) ;mRNA; f:10231-12260
MTISLVMVSARGQSLAKAGFASMVKKQRFSTRTVLRPKSPILSTPAPERINSTWMMPALLVGGSLRATTAKCEEAETVATRGIVDPNMAFVYKRALAKAHKQHLAQQGWIRYCQRALRMLVRAAKLMCTLAPVMALYPFRRLLLGSSHHDNHSQENNSKVDVHALALHGEQQIQSGGALSWYLELCLGCVEWSGAAVIKCMQWAGSRPDMFGHDFCAVFSRLQDSTTPHAWRHTERMLQEAYGDNWQDRIKIKHKNKSILGSGCIGQVYKGQVLDQDGNPMDVAVKVLHPNVVFDIDADLDLMRFFVRAVQKLPWDVFSNLKWLNLEGAVEEFADLLKLQLDCRVEAANLEQFNRNFADSEHVEFPKLVDGYAPSKNVLIETFCEGIPVIQFAKENKDNQELLSEMCFAAIESVCNMIFLHNFMHGDLHPGNVFIDPKRKKIVLFDVGIVTAYSDDDYENLVDILAALIRRQGRMAGRLMIDSSNRLLRESADHAIDEELFIDKIAAMNKKATSKDYLMENLGTYITTICQAAADHHVLINQAFISSCLAVKIQEGIAIALDPSIQIYKVATPIIFESERRRGIEKAKGKAQDLVDGIGTMFQHKSEGFVSTSAR